MDDLIKDLNDLTDKLDLLYEAIDRGNALLIRQRANTIREHVQTMLSYAMGDVHDDK